MVVWPKIPQRIGRLYELANNLWWSWNYDARTLFRILDYPLWRITGHNPVRELLEINPDRLVGAAGDPIFTERYDRVMAEFDAAMSGRNCWFLKDYARSLPGPVAYFSAEFAFHVSLPIYAGGLGVLAGDLCKEASDTGLPLIAVGFMYPQGYFHQRISAEGWQEEVYTQLNFNTAPINPCPYGNRCGPLSHVQLGERTVHIGAWQVRLGRITVYLLDTNIEENSPQDRMLSARLYTADREERIQQEIILGLGGVRLLRFLGINPAVWHANEGHTSFMMLERLRQKIEAGVSYAEAIRSIQETTVFTTHTPVPAGHDVFSTVFMEKYLRRYWESMGLDRDTFMRLGQDSQGEQSFNMTVLGLKLSRYRNGVSLLHGKVTRRMWHSFWPEVGEDEVPITHVTNGVHMPSWVAQEMLDLYRRYLGQDVFRRFEDPNFRDIIFSIPDDEMWYIRCVLKQKLVHVMRERAQRRWEEKDTSPQQVLGMGSLLDPDVLTIAFIRRFAEYKRPALILHDIERLKKIVKDRWRPVQIIFAGKSHPADFPSKYILHQVYSEVTDRDFLGRIAFVEDYDLHIARYLTQGVDVWLNVPRRLQEASGTSGMKASVNGVLNLSVKDGWWYEAYNGANGWSIGEDRLIVNPQEEDASDAASLYQLLEQQVVPLYYDRDRRNIPHQWVHKVKESIASIVPNFSSRRMLREYTDRMYLPAAHYLAGKSTEAGSVVTG